MNIELGRYTIKSIKAQKKSRGYYNNGKDNKFGEYLDSLYNNSPTHSAIVNDLVFYIIGKGLRSDSIEDNEKLKKHFDHDTTKNVVLNWVNKAAISIEVLKDSLDGSSVAKINAFNPTCFRVTEVDEDFKPTEFEYRSDWTEYKRGNLIPAYSTDESKSLFYRYDAGTFTDLPYGRPNYISCLDAIEWEISLLLGDNTGTQNGANPSAIIMKPGSGNNDENKEDANAIRNQWSGVANNNKLSVVHYSAGTSEKPQVTFAPANQAGYKKESYENAEINILKGHQISSSSLIAGLNTKSAGLAGNLEGEMEYSKNELFEKLIIPTRERLIRMLQPLFKAIGIEGEVKFIDVEEVTQELKASPLDSFIGKGEEEDLETYDLIQVDRMEGHEIDIEQSLNKDISTKLARAVVSERELDSLQDTPLFKVRYFYQEASGSKSKSREFCNKMRQAGRVYRLEDIIQAENETVNPGFGPNGSDQYSIWLYKGGANCYHWWERRVYLQKGNEKISVNEARRMILDLPIDERDENRLEQNDERVAKPTIRQENRGYLLSLKEQLRKWL